MTLGRLIYLIRRRLHLGLHHWRAERFVAPRIEKWRTAQDAPPTGVPVHLLASKHDWRMALWMLASLHHFTRRNWRVILHEDGSLGEHECKIFQTCFPGIRIWRRADADQRMSKILAEFPRCADYRRRMPHGLKSFDIPQLSDAPRFLLLDPDVLFFAEPGKLLDWVNDESDHSCWFNQDFQEPSPIPPSLALEQLGVPLWDKVNSGLCMITRSAVTDLKSMEQWLGHAALQDTKVQWRVEQTLIALAASRAGRGGTLPAAYEVSPNRRRRTNGVARHYVGCVRDRFLGEGVFEMRGLLVR